MTIHQPEMFRKERKEQRERERLIEESYYVARTNTNNTYVILVDRQRENGESIVATDFFLINPLWKRMRKYRDKKGNYILFGGRKCYEDEWLRV